MQRTLSLYPDKPNELDEPDKQNELEKPDFPPLVALWPRSRHEKYFRDQLAKAGQDIEPFLPIVQRLNRWKDRKKEVELPLFPGY